MKVFLMDDYEYWAATSLRQLARYFAHETESTIREFITERISKIVDIDEYYVWEDEDAMINHRSSYTTEEDRYWLEKTGVVITFRKYIEHWINFGHDTNCPIPIACID
ncbi:hypothetical protein [Leptospira noguchii]|uniref:hypothetical protein n=1 Tax=Leptospira noguchii TaxID=28182 RepID=UPI000773FBB2|nr:hypothetical protein [Leptospira noguchii]